MLSASTSHPGSSVKRHRGSFACIQCRARRTKCGAKPPETCSYCLKTNQRCQWPAPKPGVRRGRPRKSAEAINGWQSNPTGDVNRYPLLPSPESPASELPGSMDFAPGTMWGGSQAFGGPSGHKALHRDHTRSAQNISAFGVSSSRYTPLASSVASTAQGYGGERSRSQPGLTALQSDPITADPENHQDGLWSTASGSSGYIPPSPELVNHLLDLFFLHFGCQYPFITRAEVCEVIGGAEPGNHFLFKAIAAVSARFSNHPELAVLGLAPHSFGQTFYRSALGSLGEHFGVTSRHNVFAFQLLSLAAFGGGRPVETRMLSDIAVRMSMEMGIHLARSPDKDSDDGSIDSGDRLDNLLFWSLLIHDNTLRFIEGRPMSIDPDLITQRLPRKEDVALASGEAANDAAGGINPLHSPFPFLARTMLGLGRLGNLLNSMPITEAILEDARTVWRQIAQQYDELPLDCNWTAANLQWHYRIGSGPTYLMLHFWSYTIQAFRYIVDFMSLDPHSHISSSQPSHILNTAMSIQGESWLHCARFIGEMLVLSDVIDPDIHLAAPFVSHCMYTAECCFIYDLQRADRARTAARLSRESSASPTREGRSTDRHTSRSPASKRRMRSPPRALFATIALEHIATFRQGLSKQVQYWSGIQAVKRKFEGRLAQLASLDLSAFSQKAADVAIMRSRLGSSSTGWLGSRRNFREPPIPAPRAPAAGSAAVGDAYPLEPYIGLANQFSGPSLPFNDYENGDSWNLGSSMTGNNVLYSGSASDILRELGIVDM